MNNNTEKNTMTGKPVIYCFSMNMAKEMMRRGHKVISSKPNKKFPLFNVYGFAANEKAKCDFEDIKNKFKKA
ncbi:MAG: hypothetical protein ACRCX2_32350 [Paraclostridium sp.]